MPENVTSLSFSAKIKTSADTETAAVNQILKANPNLKPASSNIVVYDFKLCDQDGKTVTGFAGKLKVRIPISTSMNGNLHVFLYDNNKGVLTDMNAVIENGYLTFETTHFSYYVVVPLAENKTGSITLDTRSYTMSPKNIYDIGAKLVNAQDKAVKVYSSRNGISGVAKLKNGNYRISGIKPGISYVIFEVYDKNGKMLNHASVKISVQKGVKQHGETVRAKSTF